MKVDKIFVKFSSIRWVITAVPCCSPIRCFERDVPLVLASQIFSWCHRDWSCRYAALNSLCRDLCCVHRSHPTWLVIACWVLNLTLLDKSNWFGEGRRTLFGWLGRLKIYQESLRVTNGWHLAIKNSRGRSRSAAKRLNFFHLCITLLAVFELFIFLFYVSIIDYIIQTTYSPIARYHGESTDKCATWTST